ncbi:MAG TPA: hypothetical protein VFS22_00655 [Flavisolibacter sp.]|nr:hypothetical protein [Flavisolibacter sp.]
MKKTFLLSLSAVVLLPLFFVSCQKELSNEDAAKANGTAKYSFSGGTGSCTAASVTGSYTAGTAVTAANTVSLNVTVDSIGSYSVSTNTINGLTFVGQAFLQI